MKSFQEKLKPLEDKGRLRSLNLPAGLDLTSNDYLGMAVHDGLRGAARDYFARGGTIGAAGSRLLRGHVAEHAALEAFAETFFGAPKALYFANGFAANLSLFQTLPDRRDTIIFDAFIHASARDGIQASHAAHVRVAHNGLAAYETALKAAKGQAWIAVESVYSMDGDFAPLKELAALAKQYDAMLVVDEAHASGIYGEAGRGLAYELAKQDGYQNIITLHTCGKAIGVSGGLVCARPDVIDYLVNAARPFIYSTAPMPVQAFLVQKSLEILAGADGDARREKLLILCQRAQQLFGGAGSQVVPIIIGADDQAVEIAGAMQAAGYDIRAIRPPTVPEGTARLRLSLSSELDLQMLEKFARDLAPYLQDRQAA